MNKKKILIFILSAIGCVERMNVTIGRMLSKNGFDVHYMLLGKKKDIYSLIPDGANVDRIPFRNVYFGETTFSPLSGMGVLTSKE